jgi:lysophospholipase L1-like esterase
MSILRTLGTGMAAAVLALSGQSAAQAAAPPVRTTYYVSLGDSLAQGYQPGPGNTDQGYADDLHAVLRITQPGLRLVKFGCTGETTTTLLHGGHCPYDGFPSQLAAAEDFLRRHQGQVSYVTLNIGGNDLNACAGPTGVDAACVPGALDTVGTALPTVLARLRAAGGPRPKYAGNGTYDPLLAAWLSGPGGRALAAQSVQIVSVFNSLEKSVYRAAGFRMADSDAVWHTDDLSTMVPLSPYGTVPLNVAEICTFTYMCSQGNIHPNRAGYALIAEAFLKALVSKSW